MPCRLVRVKACQTPSIARQPYNQIDKYRATQAPEKAFPARNARSPAGEVQDFAGGAEQSDDMTCLALTYYGSPVG